VPVVGNIVTVSAPVWFVVKSAEATADVTVELSGALPLAVAARVLVVLLSTSACVTE